MNLLPIVSLLIGAATLLVGAGLLNLVVPVRAHQEAFGPLWIGAMGGGYYLGFIGGCLATPFLALRAGHIRVFAALAAMASCGALLNLFFVHPAAWVLVRIAVGFCLAGIYMVIESWLNAHATNATRGSVFSVYMVVNLGGVTLGQMLLSATGAQGFSPFVLCAMAISLSLVPLALTRTTAPAMTQAARLTFRELYRASPLGVTGCIMIGLANGAFWSLGPVFAAERLAGTSGVAYFMTAFVLGGAAAQWPLGRLSDRSDRRLVIIGCSAAAVAVALLLLTTRGSGMIAAMALAACAGAAMLPLYALCVAHANDFISGNRFVEASGGLLMAYGGGAVVGPLAASLVMDGLGPNALFLFTALVNSALAGIAWYRMRQRAPVPEAERTAFVARAGATPPMPTPLDPRAAE